jgi:hypothetical protein
MKTREADCATCCSRTSGAPDERHEAAKAGVRAGAKSADNASIGKTFEKVPIPGSIRCRCFGPDHAGQPGSDPKHRHLVKLVYRAAPGLDAYRAARLAAS